MPTLTPNIDPQLPSIHYRGVSGGTRMHRKELLLLMSTARRIGPSWCPLPTLGGRHCGDEGRAIIITSSNGYWDIGSA